MKEYIIKENRLYNTSEGWFLSGLKKDNLLIRCKDCKFNDGTLCTKHSSSTHTWIVDDEDYCSVARRKEE